MYTHLYDAWQSERADTTVNPLDDAFWESIREYINKLEAQIENTDPSAIISPILRQEIRNTRYMIHDIFQLRLNKLLQHVTETTTQKGWITDEQVAIQQIKEVIARMDYMIDAIGKGETDTDPQPNQSISPPASPPAEKTTQSDSSSTPKSPESSPQASKYLLVRFLAHLQSITGLDLRPYGPFQPEDIATLPVELARPLIQQNIAVEQRKGRA